MENNIFAYNNVEHYASNWSAGGSKLCGSDRVTARGNLTDHNYANGLWWDIDNTNVTIVNNSSLNDQRVGIEYEISQGQTIIASNLVVGAAIGIKVGAGSSDVKVYNNTLVRNKMDLMVSDDSRAWTTANVTIRNNILSNGLAGATELFEAVDYTSPPRTAAQMGITLDYDAYYRTSSSTPSVLARWQNSTLTPYSTIDAFRSATGQEAHGLGIDNVATNPFFVDEARGDYSLKPGSPAINAGAPLPTDIAAAVGAPAGVPVNLGVLTQ